MTTAAESSPRAVTAHRKLTTQEIKAYGFLTRLGHRCFRPDPATGELIPIDPSILSRIFSPNDPRVPTWGMARRLAAALSEELGLDVTLDDLAEYLEVELGKDLDWGKRTKTGTQE